MKTTRLPALGLAFGCALLFQGCASLPSGSETSLADHSAPAVIPAKIQYPSKIDAYIAVLSYTAANGGSMVVTSGTPSMEPLIHGQTYAAIQKVPYGSIAKDDLLVYLGRPDASQPNRFKMLHRAVFHDRHGWVMSGDNNRWSESWDRVTPDTYVGVVVALFSYPQS